MINAIALFSSSRRNGNTGQFLDRIAESLRIEVVDISAMRIAAYDYEHRNRGDDFELLMRRVLQFDHIIFASPIYWYAVTPEMKRFLDRITDFLELPDLVNEGRRLRGKNGYVVCTSVYEEASRTFISAFSETFEYLGLIMGGIAHANCRDGYVPAKHDRDALDFAEIIRRCAERAAERSRLGAR